MQSLTIEFYTDGAFDPVQNQKVTLLRTADHLYEFKTEGAGGGINEHSKFYLCRFSFGKYHDYITDLFYFCSYWNIC